MFHHSRSFARYAVAICLTVTSLLLTGCGGERISVVPVQGVVTLDGKPVPDARVIFHPIEGGRPSSGLTDEDGHYEMLYMEGQMGALTGPHKVSISTFVEADPDSADSLVQAGQKEIIPTQYNTNSTLEVDVESGSEAILDFELKS